MFGLGYGVPMNFKPMNFKRGNCYDVAFTEDIWFRCVYLGEVFKDGNGSSVELGFMRIDTPPEALAAFMYVRPEDVDRLVRLP